MPARDTVLWQRLEGHLTVEEYAPAIRAMEEAYEHSSPAARAHYRDTWNMQSVRLDYAFSWDTVRPAGMNGDQSYVFWERIYTRLSHPSSQTNVH